MTEVSDEAIRKRIEDERDQQRDKRRDELQAWYSEWLSLRAIDEDSKTEGNDEVDTERGRREMELARLITTTPAVLGWQIFHKLEVLEFYLCGNGEGTNWTYNPELVMVAGIKADLIRFDLANGGRADE